MVAKPEGTGRVGSHRFITRVPKVKRSYRKLSLLIKEGIEKVRGALRGRVGRNRTLIRRSMGAVDEIQRFLLS